MADKTNVPGVGGYSPTDERGPRPEFNGREEMSSHAKAAGNGTVIPDENGEAKEVVKTKTNRVEKDKPVLGFLYSVSRNNFGEFWPLYLGPNTIGRDGSCDICLSEGTVSSNHATLIIHKEDDGDVYAGIKDNGSTHGVKVNGKSAHFDVAACNNMDIIKIGKCYELLFIMIDAEKLGLKPAENFIEVKRSAAKQVDRRIITGPGQGAAPATYFNHSSRIANPSSDRTRSMDGEAEPAAGGTIPR